MAVLRDSKPVGAVSLANAPALRGARLAQKAPDVDKFTKGASTSDILIDAVVKNAIPLASKAWEVQQEEQYLSGVRQASQVQSEEELQSSPLTRDWVKAGFRDTKGRIEQAQFTANAGQAVKEALQQPDPQKYFSDWLAQAGQKVTQQYSGMSRRARSASFAQHAVDIQTAQAGFTKEYAKYIVQQEEASIVSSFTAARAVLDNSKDNVGAYRAASDSFTTGVYTNIWLNDKLPEDTKRKLTREALEYAASSDNVLVYQTLKEQQYTFGDGSKGTIMQRLPFEDQVALDTAYRNVQERTKVIRGADFEDSMARMRAEWADKDGPGPTISYTELVGQLDLAQENGLLGKGKRESYLKEYFTAASRNAPNNRLAQLYAAGDFPGLVQAGGSQEDGLRAYLKANEGRPYQEVVQGLLSIGNNNTGMDSAFTKAGELLSPALGQLGYAETIDPESAHMAQAFVQAMDEAEKTNPGVYSRAMQGLSSENQDMVLFMREAQRTAGISDPLVAVQYARTQLENTRKLGPLASTLQAEANKQDVKGVQEIGDRQLLGTISGGFKSFFSQDAATRQRLSTGRAWFEDTTRTAEVRATAQVALSEELAIISKGSPFLPADARMSKALGNIAARTVDTSSGPLIIPRGANIREFFNAGQYADQAYIGKAIDDIVELQDGERIAWYPTQDGKLIGRRFGPDGEALPSISLNPQDVGAKVQENLERDAALASNQIGPGKVVSKGGAAVQFNGQNTAGFSPAEMLLLREDIVNSEGVADVAYGDGKVVEGNRAFGVGISQTGKRFQEPLGRDGKYTQTQINSTFMAASNDAAEEAAKVMRGVGLAGPEWLRFFGELSYQSPASARNKDMLAYIQLGNLEQAEAALRSTNGYKNSPPARQEAYIKKLRKAMK